MGFRSFTRTGLATLGVAIPLAGLGWLASDRHDLVRGLLFPTKAEAHANVEVKGFPSSAYVRSPEQGKAGPMPIPTDAQHLFARDGKGPRADRYKEVAQTSEMEKPLRLAALPPVDGNITGAIPPTLEPQELVDRSGKGDPIILPLAKLASMQPEPLDTRPSAALFLASLRGADSYAFPGSEPQEEKAEQETEQKPEGGPVKLPRTLPFQGETEAEYQGRQRRCLATAIYFEARGETERGQIAVAQVVMNRVRSSLYPDTICGVVFQGQWNKNACQFSFACDGLTDVPKEAPQWLIANKIAKRVLDGQVWLEDIGHATHYHATYVKPPWRRQMNHVMNIGQHIFYQIPKQLIEDVLTDESPERGLALQPSG